MLRLTTTLTLLTMLSSACQNTTEKTEEQTIVATIDADLDGFEAADDCNDGDASIFPNAMEICDGIDNDCDGEVDEGVTLPFFADTDADGFGNENVFIEACEQPAGFVANGSDCDDTQANVFPGGEEVCDNLDNDCNGQVDENLGDTFYFDEDQDGYGGSTQTIQACTPPEGYRTTSNDCDDINPAVNPSADEICDGIDNNCNAEVDESTAIDAPTWYEDNDNDGFGNPLFAMNACLQPAGFVVNDLDCDDINSQAYPGAAELCNEIDDNCDGQIDENTAIDATIWYADSDNDGYGDAAVTKSACTQPSGFITNNTDCDDNDDDSYPTATERCNGEDNDCNGNIDDNAINPNTWYADNDNDGYGDSLNSILSCDQPTGYIADNTDCDDENTNVNPVSIEECNSIDDNCDGQVDESGATAQLWYLDGDADGFGDASTTEEACNQPTGYVADNTDCDDNDDDSYPSAIESCNGSDDDCNGVIDDNAIDRLTLYADSDSDGFGNAASSIESCDLVTGYVSDSTDCDDSSDTIYPDASEIWYDGIDQDCDNNSDYDQDGDGIDSIDYGGNDCNDEDASISDNCTFGSAMDGALYVDSSGTVINSYSALSGNTISGDSTFAVDDSSFFAVGMQLLIIQMQGDSAGTYEFNYIQSLNGNTITLATALTEEYLASDGAQVVSVPNYSEVTITSNGQLVAPSWNGSTGGIVAFRSLQSTTVDGSINVNEQGYRGGPEVNNTSNLNGYYGESIYPYLQPGSNQRNIGGGGSSYCSCGEAAGAGGYGTSGGSPSGSSCSNQPHGEAGSTYGLADLSQLFHGSGGGGGCRDDNSCEYSRGRHGGGIIFIASDELLVNGSITANGESANGGQNGNCDDTIGGAGSGGSIFLRSNTATIGSGTITAVGGGSTYISQSNVTTGIGGFGRIRIDFQSLNGHVFGSTDAETELQTISSPVAGHSESP